MYIDVEDYFGGMRTITIPAEITGASFTINITDNSVVECPKSFTIRIVSVTGSGVTIGNVDNTEVVIMDNNGEWKFYCCDLFVISV